VTSGGVFIEDDPYRAILSNLQVCVALVEWGRIHIFVTTGNTGFKSESKGVTAMVYLKLTENKLIPACRHMMECRPVPLSDQPPSVFRQDNAPAHAAKTTQAWLQSPSDFVVMKLRLTTPDLSCVENVWGIVAKELQARTHVTC
jgi:hypothetical protein